MLTLNPQHIASQLEGSFFRLHCLQTTPSTNEEIKQAAREGASEGLVYSAMEQRAGYGRQGRQWVSAPGGLYMSLLLKPAVDQAALPPLSLVVSVAVRQALLALGCGQDVAIKWPNDVLCARGKLCGISLEVVEGAVCIGIGLNVFRPAEQRPVGGKNTPAYVAEDPAWEQDARAQVAATGLDAPQCAQLERVAATLLNSVERCYHRWLREGFAGFVATYNTHLALVGTAVSVANAAGDTLAQGTVDSVDGAGRLVLRAPDGSSFPLVSGEVHLL
ncbi:MAG: biotin--[acetyl-CoA-carboxylase] ligase [Raoultibacter sp.]